MSFRSRHLVTVLCLTILPALASHADSYTYRWTDAAGNFQYSDTLPSGAAERGYEVIDSATGTVVREVAPRKTQAEKAREEAERIEAEKTRQEAEKQARRDRVLLALYSSVEDIERARDNRLDRIDARIDNLTESIERISQRLSRGGGEHDDATEMRELSETRAHLEFERHDIEERFERDIQRFRELKGLD